MKYRKQEELEFTRTVMGTGDHRFAVVDCRYGVKILGAVRFALPPDGEPTGRLWARLEKLLI